MVSTQSFVKSSENSSGDTRQSPSPSRRRACGTRSTVRATGFSLAQTGNSLAQSVAPVSVFRPAQGLFASVFAAEFVNIYDHEIHVFRQVCNNFCATTTFLVVQVVQVVVLKI